MTFAYQAGRQYLIVSEKPMERNEFFLKCFSAETHLNQVIGQGVVLCHGASSFLWTLTACDAWAKYPSELLNSFSFPFWWYLSKLYIKLIRLSNASQLPHVRLNVPYSAAALCLPFPFRLSSGKPRVLLSRSCLWHRCSAGARYWGLPHPHAAKGSCKMLSPWNSCCCPLGCGCFAVGGGLCSWIN